MSSIKDKVTDAAESVADAATDAAHWVRDKVGMGNDPKGITERMDVLASCGTKVGVIDHLEDGAIKLTKSSSPDDQHHFIPTSWVGRVDSQVHLTKNSSEVRANWKTDAKACGSCGC
jgi:hypothetical protein